MIELIKTPLILFAVSIIFFRVIHIISVFKSVADWNGPKWQYYVFSLCVALVAGGTFCVVVGWYSSACYLFLFGIAGHYLCDRRKCRDVARFLNSQ